MSGAIISLFQKFSLVKPEGCLPLDTLGLITRFRDKRKKLLFYERHYDSYCILTFRLLSSLFLILLSIGRLHNYEVITHHIDDQFQEDQYAEWVSACRLGSRGRSLADASFATEAAAVRSLLALQRPQPGAGGSPLPLPQHMQPEHYVAPRFYKKLKSKVGQVYFHGVISLGSRTLGRIYFPLYFS